jgi:hypothetical protein
MNRAPRAGTLIVSIVVLVLAQCSRERSVVPMGYGDSALSNPRFVWDSITAPGFTLYTNRGSYGAERATQYRGEVTVAISHALAMLGESRFGEHLQVFVMGSREDVEAVTGTGWNGWTDPAGRNLAVVAREECRPVFRHEVMHAVSLVLWGNPLVERVDPNPPPDPDPFGRGGWLREGIAAAAEDVYGKYSYRGMAAQWQAEGTLLPLDSLVNSFYRQDDLAAYLEAGSLVQYLLERYGSASLREVWREGPGAFDRVYGRSFTQLEADWHEWLRATPASARPASIAVARAEDRCPPRRRP